MVFKTANPELRAAATGSGMVVHSQAINTPEIAPSLAEVQIIFVAKRMRLAPDRARLVAGLAFPGRCA